MIIPQSLNECILDELHKEHMGLSRVKALAWSHVWWSEISKDLDMMVSLASPEASSSHSTYASLGDWPKGPGNINMLTLRVH